MILHYSSQARSIICKLHPDLKKGIRYLLENLAANPYLGKPLRRELAGYYSLAYKQYRIIYELLLDKRITRVHYVGHRSEVYEKFLQLLPFLKR